MADDRSDRPVVLAVDDDEEVIETYRLWLSDEYDLRTATDGKEGLEQLDETVDVVLLDRLMPNMSGEEVLKKIRARDIDCRVAMATAVEPDEDIASMPFDAYVTKALERESVVETIEKLLVRSEADDIVQEHYAVAEKLAALEDAKPASALADSDEYQRLQERFNELDTQVSDLGTTFTRDDIVDTLGEIEVESTMSDNENQASVPVPPDAYDILAGMGVSETRPVAPGTSLLVSAPITMGREFVLRSLERGLQDEEGGLIITTNESVQSLIEEINLTTLDLLRIVDARSDETGLNEDHPVAVQDIDTPRNLTDIGIGFTNAFSEFDDLGVHRGRFGLLSLSIVLSYVNQETAYRFCQTLSRGLDQEEFVGFFLLDQNAHDRQTQDTLRRAVDGFVEIRSGEDGRELRVTGIEEASSEWVSLS